MGELLYFFHVCVCWKLNLFFVLNIHSLIHTIFVYCTWECVSVGQYAFLFGGNNM